MSKKKYVSLKIKNYVNYCNQKEKPIDFLLIKELIKQWEFDYEMEYALK